MRDSKLLLSSCGLMIAVFATFASCADSPDVEPTGPGAAGPGNGGNGGSGATGPASSGVGAEGGGGSGATGANGGAGTGGEPPCPKGTILCEGTIKKVCDGMGGYQEEIDCAPSICIPGGGCVICEPGTGTCNGEVGTWCKDDGTGYIEEECDPLQGTICNPATGQCDGACGLKSLGKSYIGCDYWPTVTANLVNSSSLHFAVAVSNTTANPAQVTVTKGAGQTTQVMVGANSVQVINLPWVAALKGPNALAPLGNVQAFPASIRVDEGAYRLRSTEPVTVYQFNALEYELGNGCDTLLPDLPNCSYSNDASLLFPATAWTGTYRVGSWQHFGVTSGFYAVTAAKDGTVVTVTAAPNGGVVKTGVAGIPASGNGQVTLNAGDVIQIVTNTPDTSDLSGTLIGADKPVQVIGGHQCTYIPEDVAACDHLEESIFPYETLPNEFIVAAPWITENTAKVEMVRIIATQPDTSLTYDPPQPGAPAAISQEGAWVELANNIDNFQITANKPVMVAQYMEGQDAGGSAGDPAMALVVGKTQYRASYLFHAPTNYESNFVNIVAPTGEAVLLDGAAVGGFSAIGATGFSVARVKLPSGGNGNHTATSAQPFGVSVYGYGQYTSYWYPAGLDLKVLHE